ncbi:hypothetical protein [uncultured Draconibacterium sp.]|uniref:hypothetical protein n=1 Tax=uncultured Draconibacterium sp. TaxID=1573823 RepID=UPI0026026291|nr:hypothetical protein [uncultured Draconibacterium sp.]
MNLSIDQWAKITIKLWQERLQNYKIGDSGKLAQSFYHHVNREANGDKSYVLFAFEYYGKMVEWGVGKGVTIANRGHTQTTREKKPWFSDVFFKRLDIIKNEMVKSMSRDALLFVKTNLEKYNIDGSKISPGRSHSKKSTSSSTGEGYSVADYKRVRFK